MRTIYASKSEVIFYGNGVVARGLGLYLKTPVPLFYFRRGAGDFKSKI